VAQPGEPVHAVVRQGLQIAAHRIDEHQLAQVTEHGPAANAWRLRLRERDIDTGGDRAARFVVDADDARKRIEQRVVGSHVAAQEAAHEVHGLAALTHRDVDGELPVLRPAIHRHIGRFAHADAARQHVGVAMRQHDDVAGVQPQRRLVAHARPARALRYDVIGDEVLGAGARKHRANYRFALGRLGDPGLRGLHVEEDGAGETHGSQNIRQRIHRLHPADDRAREPDGRSFASRQPAVRLSPSRTTFQYY
jgi:hypothetical protein